MSSPPLSRTTLHRYSVLVLVVVLFLTVILALRVGPVDIPFDLLWKYLLLSPTSTADQTDTLAYIVVNLRLARTVLTIVVGACLALAGVVYQGVLLNPLADPYTLGVSTGAAFGASLAILFGPSSGYLFGIGVIPGAAFAGAMAALSLVYLLGRVDGKLHPATLILAGIIVSTFLSALISFLKSLHEESISTIVFWIMGSLGGKNWQHVLLLLPYLLVGTIVIYYYAPELDILSLGDLQAEQLGVAVLKARILLLLTASLITAASVSITGIIGFVGLVVPHLVRLISGPRHGTLITYSILVGATLLLLADTIARSILGGGQELPVGVITALIGGPFFCAVLLSRRQHLRTLS